MPDLIKWPKPFHLEDDEIAAHVENLACQITNVDGTQLVGTLQRFRQSEGAFEIRQGRSDEISSIQMDTVRSLRLLHPLYLKKQGSLSDANSEEVDQPSRQQKFSVTFKDGKKLEGQTAGYVNQKYGTYLFEVDESGAIFRLFIPATAMGSFSIRSPIGQMLIEEKAVTHQEVEAGLALQKLLRSQRIGDYLTGEEIITVDQLAKSLERHRGNTQLKLGDALIQDKLITQAQLDEALLKQQADRKQSLGEILGTMGIVSPETIKRTLAKKLGILFVNVQKFNIDPGVIALVPEKLVEKYTLLPLYRTDKKLIVAMEDPMQTAPLEELRFILNLTIEPVMALKEDLLAAINLYYKSKFSSEAVDDLAASVKVAKESKEVADDEAPGTDNTLVKFVNMMILDAFRQGASDIHVETAPGNRPSRVRFRKDGIMVKQFEFPSQFKRTLVSRIKIMAQLDISERRKPQDGKIEFRHAGLGKLELRVATIPTANTLEDIVMRVLVASKPIPLDRLDLAQDYLEAVKILAAKSFGLFLICGPTGSGKTTTLHSVLGHINTDDRKIWTAEDPIEITQEGLRQVQINSKIGWTFATAMRSFLRADPDVIMVGEMRDAETCKMGIEASLTGHLVLSTLHTNSAIESIVRLLDLGMDPFNFADALLGVLSQRLVRRLCNKCKKSYSPSDVEMRALVEEYCFGIPLDPKVIYQHWQKKYLKDSDTLTLYSKTGCNECDGSGYKGRIAVQELLVVTPEMRKLIQRRAPVEEMLGLAITQAMRTLKQDGIEKVLQGHTDIQQVRSL